MHGTMPLRATIAPGPNHQTWEEAQVRADPVTESNLGIGCPNLSPEAHTETAVRQTRQTGRNRPVSCPTCPKTFERTDVLRRHQSEQHSTEREHFLCPHDPCKKSKQGSGFKREDQLKRHLKTCKTLKRKAVILSAIDKAGPTGLEILPKPANENQDVTRVVQETEGRLEVQNGLKSSSGGCDLISELRKRRELEQTELDQLDQEREKKRQMIACIDQVIKNLDH